MRTLSAKTKDGRAWIAAVLEAATSIVKIDFDLVTDTRALQSTVSADLIKRFVEIDGRRARLYETAPREYIYLVASNDRYVTRYILRTYAFDVSDLPEIPEDAADAALKHTTSKIEIEIDEPSSCDVCGGELLPLGTLGNRTHFRCRRCGSEQST